MGCCWGWISGCIDERRREEEEEEEEG